MHACVCMRASVREGTEPPGPTIVVQRESNYKSISCEVLGAQYPHLLSGCHCVMKITLKKVFNGN
jgi:hypothetical protein